MKKIVITLNLLLLVGLVSCKEDASKEKEEAINQINESSLEESAGQVDDSNKDFPVITFEKTEHDFGKIPQNVPQETVFKFKNTGNAPLIITDAKSSCGCTVPEKPEGPIAPGETGELVVKYNAAGTNAIVKTVTITSNTAKGTEQISIKAFVTPKDSTAVGPLK